MTANGAAFTHNTQAASRILQLVVSLHLAVPTDVPELGPEERRVAKARATPTRSNHVCRRGRL
jgi:hypothetical protein